MLAKSKQIIDTIQNFKGATLVAAWESNVKVLKNVQKELSTPLTVVKRTATHVVSGIDLANRAEIKKAIAEGERGPLGALPYGKWEQFPFVIGHTKKDGTYHEYIRLYPPTDVQVELFHLKTEVEFFANGQPISRDIAIQYCGAEAKANDEKPICFCPDVDNITYIGDTSFPK